MNSDTEFKEGDHQDFITYLYSDTPREKGEVKLELPLNEPGKNLGLHEFEQLLMIYEVSLDIFPTMNEYIFKHPNYFKDQKHITNSTELKDYYYEVYGKDNCVFRISFKTKSDYLFTNLLKKMYNFT